MFFIKKVCLAQPNGGQVVCCAGPMRVSYTDFLLCCTIWDGATLFLVRRYRGNISNSAAHGTGLIHRACAGNDLTARGFGNYLSDTSPLRNDLPLAERYSDKRYKAPGPQAFGNVGGQIEPGQKTISRKPARLALLVWRAWGAKHAKQKLKYALTLRVCVRTMPQISV